MKEINRTSNFNILHVCDYQAPYADIATYVDYPGQVVNSPLDLTTGKVSGKEVARLFGRPFFGGLDRKGILAHGTKEQIVAAVKEAIEDAPDRYMLGADCTIPAGVPWENLRIAIDAAHAYRR